MDGIINVCKPSGPTSFRIVALVRRWSGERKVGHAGTLDPEASGVLVIALGQATRVLEFLSDKSKAYWAVVELGMATDTYDAQGQITQRGDYSAITCAQVSSLLRFFQGPLQQIPPMFSALKRDGVPLYRLARSGVTIERQSREITIHRLEMLDWDPPLFTLNVECSKGTYIRSLAHDVGQALGCGAHLKTLVRWQSGPFHIQDSVTLPELEAAFQSGRAEDFLHALDTALLDRMAAIVGGDREAAVRSGRYLDLGAGAVEKATAEGGQWCRGYSTDGDMIALLRLEPGSNLWHPEKVFATPANTSRVPE